MVIPWKWTLLREASGIKEKAPIIFAAVDASPTGVGVSVGKTPTRRCRRRFPTPNKTNRDPGDFLSFVTPPGRRYVSLRRLFFILPFSGVVASIAKRNTSVSRGFIWKIF